MVVYKLSEKEVKNINNDIYVGTKDFFEKMRKLEDESQKGCGPRFESARPSYPTD
jgi:hypothetical protein